MRATFSLGKSVFAFASDVFVLKRRFSLSEPRFHSVSAGIPVFAFDYDFSLGIRVFGFASEDFVRLTPFRSCDQRFR